MTAGHLQYIILIHLRGMMTLAFACIHNKQLTWYKTEYLKYKLTIQGLLLRREKSSWEQIPRWLKTEFLIFFPAHNLFFPPNLPRPEPRNHQSPFGGNHIPFAGIPFPLGDLLHWHPPQTVYLASWKKKYSSRTMKSESLWLWFLVLLFSVFGAKQFHLPPKAEDDVIQVISEKRYSMHSVSFFRGQNLYNIPSIPYLPKTLAFCFD